jgi:hypothetical protein
MANSFYETQAARFIEIDETDNGQLFCTIPSEKDVNIRYRLECVESATGVEVLTCGCPSRKHDCKHRSVVQNFWNRIYRSNIAKVAKVEQVSPVEEVAIVETPEIVEQPVEVVPPIAMDLPDELKGYRKTAKVGKPGSVELSSKGNLNGNSGFSVLRKVG